MASPIPVPDFAPQPDEICYCGSGEPFGECCGTAARPRRLPKGVMRIAGFISPKECRRWVSYLERRPRARAQIFDPDQSAPGQPVYKEDPARVCDDVHPGKLLKTINQAIMRAYRVATRHMDREIEWFERPRILRYSVGGNYRHHSDAIMWDPESETYFKVEDRNLSLLIYINDDFEGGGLTFTRLNCHIRPRIGDVIMFPSGLRYEHRAEKVTRGFRYAIASWAAFRDDPRVRSEPPPLVIPMKSAGK